MNKKIRILHFLILVFALANISFLQSMRHQIVHASPDEKIIEDYHGTIFTVPASTIEKCGGFFQTLADFDTFYFETSDIWDQLFSRRFPKSDISFFQTKAADTPLSKEILKATFECITPFFEEVKLPEEKSEKIKAIIESIDKDHIRSIFSVINYLGPQKEKVAKKLAQRMKAIIPYDELKEDNEIDVIVLSGIYDKTIQKLLKRKNQWGFYNQRVAQALELKGMKLDNLKGIEKITIESVRLLYLNDNALRTLDIAYLKKKFPKLTYINASNNCITTLILPSKLQERLTIELKNNLIKELPTFSLDGDCTINLKGNPLSEDAHKKIRKALTPPFFIKNRHHLIFWANNAGYLIRGVFFGGLIGMPLGTSLATLYYCPRTTIIAGIALGLSASTSSTIAQAIPYFMIAPYLAIRLNLDPEFSNHCTGFVPFVHKFTLGSSLALGFISLISETKNIARDYERNKYIQRAKIFTDADDSAKN